MLGKLLAQDGIVRKLLADPLAQQLLGLAVGDGDRCGVLFPFDGQVGPAKVTERQLPGFADDGQRQLQPARQVAAVKAERVFGRAVRVGGIVHAVEPSGPPAGCQGPRGRSPFGPPGLPARHAEIGRN